ncbi:MAG TPA: HDIG domain-containing protein [Candidatus Aenigmarchaeota archaeon]|nr:HDIG domain-containing protein [Candidatus Aenigmarchaeota archaeon]
MISREEAFSLLKENLKNQNLVKHCLAVEAIMRELAKYLGEDKEKWGLLGLIHDIDYEKTKDNPKIHGILAAEEILKDKVDEDILKAIKSHNFENTGIKPETKMEKALIASDSISGLIVACALVMPSKKLEEVRIETVKKKFKQKDFARNCKRERILFCEQIGIPREKFFEIGLNALKKISEELGL